MYDSYSVIYVRCRTVFSIEIGKSINLQVYIITVPCGGNSQHFTCLRGARDTFSGTWYRYLGQKKKSKTATYGISLFLFVAQSLLCVPGCFATSVHEDGPKARAAFRTKNKCSVCFCDNHHQGTPYYSIDHLTKCCACSNHAIHV